MSHTQGINAQSDVEHIDMAAEAFMRVVSDLATALDTAVSDQAKVALTALIEIAKSGATTARRCHEQITQAQAASGPTH
jgi:hypothetical protein